jgi:hypothetical protein
MVLHETDREMLEKEIDLFVKNIPHEIHVHIYRDIEGLLQVKEVGDFVLGLGIGYIICPFLSKYVSKHGRKPTDEEFKDIRIIIVNHANEIREAILKT